MADTTAKGKDKRNRAIKYRLYPTAEQKDLFARTFGCCRKIWNLMLEDKIAYYKETGGMLHNTPARYKDQYTYLREVDSLALANVQLDLQMAYQNFFRDKKTGFPKFKAEKTAKKSYTTNNQHGTVTVGDKSIRLPKIGEVRAKIHRRPEDGWVLKSATVSMDKSGRYYVSVLFEYEAEPKERSVSEENAVGLDYKSDGLYRSSDGDIASLQKCFRESQEKLAKAQRKLKHKTVGSNNYEKQKTEIARIYVHAANQRKDQLQKLSTEIANQYDIICIEDLDIKAMSNKAFHNGKATMDNGFGMFVRMLEYKLTDRGKILIKIDKWYPSTQVCSHCGHQQKLGLKDRTYICPACGEVMDRDLNAAINIREEGLRLLRESA